MSNTPPLQYLSDETGADEFFMPTFDGIGVSEHVDRKADRAR
jgi:hypothetical protein